MRLCRPPQLLAVVFERDVLLESLRDALDLLVESDVISLTVDILDEQRVAHVGSVDCREADVEVDERLEPLDAELDAVNIDLMGRCVEGGHGGFSLLVVVVVGAHQAVRSPHRW